MVSHQCYNKTTLYNETDKMKYVYSIMGDNIQKHIYLHLS